MNVFVRSLDLGIFGPWELWTLVSWDFWTLESLYYWILGPWDFWTLKSWPGNFKPWNLCILWSLDLEIFGSKIFLDPRISGSLYLPITPLLFGPWDYWIFGPEIFRPCIFFTLGLMWPLYLWTIRSVDPWTFGPWDIWTLEYLVLGIFVPWYLWALMFLDPEMFGPWDVWTLGSFEPGIFVPWNLWTLGSLDPEIFGPWNLWTLESLDRGIVWPWDILALGYLNPRIYGPWDIWALCQCHTLPKRQAKVGGSRTWKMNVVFVASCLNLTSFLMWNFMAGCSP